MINWQTKNNIDDSIGEGTIVRFNRTLQSYLKVSVGNDTYNLTKDDKIQITKHVNKQITKQQLLNIQIQVAIVYRIGL